MERERIGVSRLTSFLVQAFLKKAYFIFGPSFFKKSLFLVQAFFKKLSLFLGPSFFLKSLVYF